MKETTKFKKWGRENRSRFEYIERAVYGGLLNEPSKVDAPQEYCSWGMDKYATCV